MTVGELIALLQKERPTARVVIGDGVAATTREVARVQPVPREVIQSAFWLHGAVEVYAGDVADA